MRDDLRDPARPAVLRARGVPRGKRVRAVGGYVLALIVAVFAALVALPFYAQAMVEHALCGVEVAMRLLTMLAGHLPNFCKA